MYRVEFRPYQRPFRQPLLTSHGDWRVREGVIVGLQDGLGRKGWGEIAPLPWFGSEDLETVLAFCQGLGGEISAQDIEKIPMSLPACQFGFETALADLLSSGNVNESEFAYSYLLPAGKEALEAWWEGWSQGGRTFKWKIGVLAGEVEREIFTQLLRQLPAAAKFRLDANGGLSEAEAREWLQVTNGTQQVEFFEQPLPPGKLEMMLQLSQDYETPLALDESVATLSQLKQCYQDGWRGIFVVKGAIAGSPKQLRSFCRQHDLDLVFSSVFETEIGRKAVLQLARELSSPHRAVGFGVQSWLI
jgi:O-succinylbenzoate synthase